MKKSLWKSAKFLLIFTIICGVIYTGFVTIFAQAFFPEKANGSIIEINGKKYGSELLAQKYTDEKHMWGRIMQLDVSTYKDKDGKPLLYAVPSNLSPASDEYEKLVSERVKMLKTANPQMK
ncbi:MAG: potassium-transporting ATPase subunit C, partial [Oscillospiraceae bacterium]